MQPYSLQGSHFTEFQKKVQDEGMSGDCVGLKRRSLVTKVGQFAYWGALAVVFAWATSLRFRLPLDPIADGDALGYLYPGLSELSGTGFVRCGRNFLYPGFLFLLLRCFGDFRAITIVQHLLGIATGGMFLITWRRIRDFLPHPNLPYPMHRCFGLLAGTLYLLAEEPIRFEAQIRPEGIFAFLVILNIYLILRFTASCFLRPDRGIPVGYGIAAVFSSAVMVFAKPSFGIAALGVLVPVGAALFRSGQMWRKVALTTGATLSVVLLAVPEYFFSRDDPRRATFLPTDLFMIHADIVRDQMAADLAENVSSPYGKDWLTRVHAALDIEIKKSIINRGGEYYPTLGFDPDYLMYKPGSTDAQLRRMFHNNVRELCAFYRFYYRRIWHRQPIYVLKKITRQMSVFYASSCPAYDNYSVPMAGEYMWSALCLRDPQLRAVWIAYQPAVEFMKRTLQLRNTASVLEQSKCVRWLFYPLARSYLAVFFMSVAISLAVLCKPRLRQRWGWFAALVLFLYWYNAGNCLEVAVFHTLDIGRYRTAQLIFTILAQFTASLLMLEVALEALYRFTPRIAGRNAPV